MNDIDPIRQKLVKRCEKNDIRPTDFAPFIAANHQDDHTLILTADNVEQVIDHLLYNCEDDPKWIDEIIDMIIEQRKTIMEMGEEDVTITLTRKEAERLCTLITNLNARLQYEGATNPKNIDRYSRFWHAVNRKIANSIGFDAYSVPSTYVDALIDASKSPQDAL